MLLAIDIGNTNIVTGIFTENKLTQQFRLISDVSKSVEDYSVDIIEQLLTFGIDPKQLSDCIIGSVVPTLRKKVADAITRFSDAKILNISDNIELDIKTDLENEDEIGSDRLINAIAAFHKFQQSLIIIDFGTATTFDVIDQNGVYLGGVIAPGINLSLKALHVMTAKLPKIEIKKQDFVIGKNTKQAMNSGVYFGYLSLIEGMVTKIKKELTSDTKVIMTGGLASLFQEYLQLEIEQDLTLEGLNLIARNNIYKKI